MYLFFFFLLIFTSCLNKTGPHIPFPKLIYIKILCCVKERNLLYKVNCEADSRGFKTYVDAVLEMNFQESSVQLRTFHSL